MQSIEVIRIGNRAERDRRVTTHCALVARALGATKITICGAKETDVERSLRGVNARWGKGLAVRWEKSASKTLRKAKKEKRTLVHLTMYGEPFENRAEELKKAKKLSIIVGAEKVPPEVYRKSDYNLSVTNQPHSEIAALAIVLYALTKGIAKFSNARLKITPTERGKNVERKKRSV